MDVSTRLVIGRTNSAKTRWVYQREFVMELIVVGFGVARYIIVVVAMATAISLLAQQISSIRL